MVTVENGCSSGNRKEKTDLKMWGMKQERLIIDKTIEEKEGMLNSVEYNQFDTLIFAEFLLYSRPCMSLRADTSNTCA